MCTVQKPQLRSVFVPAWCMAQGLEHIVTNDQWTFNVFHFVLLSFCRFDDSFLARSQPGMTAAHMCQFRLRAELVRIADYSILFTWQFDGGKSATGLFLLHDLWRWFCSELLACQKLWHWWWHLLLSGNVCNWAWSMSKCKYVLLNLFLLTADMCTCAPQSTH